MPVFVVVVVSFHQYFHLRYRHYPIGVGFIKAKFAGSAAAGSVRIDYVAGSTGIDYAAGSLLEEATWPATGEGLTLTGRIEAVNAALFETALRDFKARLEEDPIVHRHLSSLYDTLLQQNLCRSRFKVGEESNALEKVDKDRSSTSDLFCEKKVFDQSSADLQAALVIVEVTRIARVATMIVGVTLEVAAEAGAEA
nr:26S proteasome non-ATPase regulatory subunit 11 homolog [Populus alba]